MSARTSAVCMALLGVAACHSPAAARASASASASPATQPRWLTLPVPPPMPRPDTMILVAAPGGARLYAAVFHRGGPAPVLLLHGGSASSDMWAAEVRRLAPSHAVIVMDARGHGRSTLGTARLSYELLATDALEVLDTLGVARAAVIGMSDGGIVGLLLAIEHPSRLAGLFAWGANFDHSGIPTPAGPPDSAAIALGRRFVAWAEADYRQLSPTPDGFPALQAALDDLYAREPAIPPESLRAIRVPSTIADGGHEQFITRAHTERLAALIPGARLIILPDVSHGGPLQDPEAFHAAVATFLTTARF